MCLINIRSLPLLSNQLPTGQKWHTHRKMITPAFHFTILESFVEVFSEKSEILISKLQKEVGSQGFDVYPYITKCALDIICGKHRGILFLFYNDKYRHEIFWGGKPEGKRPLGRTRRGWENNIGMHLRERA